VKIKKKFRNRIKIVCFEIIHKENPIVHINYLLSFAEMRQINMYYLEPVFLLNNSIYHYQIPYITINKQIYLINDENFKKLKNELDSDSLSSSFFNFLKFSSFIKYICLFKY